MFALGMAGQAGYSFLYERLEQKPDTTPFLDRVANSAWMPVKSLSDEEYERIVQSRISKLDADIANVEGQMATLEHQKRLLSSPR